MIPVMFHFCQHSSYNLKDMWVSCCIIFSYISCNCKNWCPFKLKSSGTGKHLLEKIRVVGWLRIQEMNRVPCVWEQCHGKEISCVPTRFPVISFALFQTDALKQLGIPHDSLLDFYEQNHNETNLNTRRKLWGWFSHLVCTFFGHETDLDCHWRLSRDFKGLCAQSKNFLNRHYVHHLQ